MENPKWLEQPKQAETTSKLILYPNVHAQKSILHSLKMEIKFLCCVDFIVLYLVN